MRLRQDARQLRCGVGAVFEWVQIPEDLLQQLHVVLPDGRQTQVLQTLLLLLMQTGRQTNLLIDVIERERTDLVQRTTGLSMMPLR